MGSLNQEQVEENLATNIEHKAEVDSCTAAAFGREVPCID